MKDNNVTYGADVTPEYISIMCAALNYDHESPLFAKLIKDGVDEPIISAKFYGFYDRLQVNISANISVNILEESSVNNDSCYSDVRPNEKGGWEENLLPCFTSWDVKVNENFWWCGFLADKCVIDAEYETRIIFTITYYLTIPFIHVGNYTCQIAQNGEVRNATFSIENGICTC